MSSSRNKKREPDTSNITEDEEKEASPSDTTKKRSKTGVRGIPLTLNVQSENEANSITLLVDNFAISHHQAKIVLKACRMLQPEDPAIFVSFRDAPHIHQALSLPGPGRPCQPGNDAIESFNALKTWVQSKLPTGNQTKALLISGGASAVAFGNLSQAEYNAVIPTLIHHPNDFTWAAGIRTQGLSCGAMLCMTGTGVGVATVAKLPSTIFFDD
jgi:hypothetical protein